MALALSAIGWIAYLIGVGWIIVYAFQNDEKAWGILSFFLPIVVFIYGFMNWHELKVPLLTIFGSFVPLYLGASMGGSLTA